MNYILKVTTQSHPTNSSKPQKFIYTVLNQEGKEISTRKSFRKYVAATINGQFYFGRLDLIGKGDHGKQLKYCEKMGLATVPIAFITPEQTKVWEMVEEFETFAEKQFNQQHPEANP